MKKITLYLCIFYWTLPGSNTHKKTYGFNDLEHCIEVINVTNAYEQEKIKLLRLWTIETEKYNSEICQPLRFNLTSLKIDFDFNIWLFRESAWII